jgi:hypothetical protein
MFALLAALLGGQLLRAPAGEPSHATRPSADCALAEA